MNVYSFCSSQSMGLLARSRPSPDVLLSTTASKGSSWPWILNAQISPVEGRKTADGDPENFQAEDRVSPGPNLQTPKPPGHFLHTKKIVKLEEEASGDPEQHAHFMDGKIKVVHT